MTKTHCIPKLPHLWSGSFPVLSQLTQGVCHGGDVTRELPYGLTVWRQRPVSHPVCLGQDLTQGLLSNAASEGRGVLRQHSFISYLETGGI